LTRDFPLLAVLLAAVVSHVGSQPKKMLVKVEARKVLETRSGAAGKHGSNPDELMMMMIQVMMM
jgi:hypothetical protein